MQKTFDFLKKIPIPISGLILGLVSLGNLFNSLDFPVLGNLYAVFGLFLLVLVLLKIIFTMNHALSTLQDPIVGSVSPTFTMALMVTSVYLNGIFPGHFLVTVLWWFAVVCHIALMIYFVYLHVLPEKLHIGHVYPSWFITFVGLGVISITSPSFSLSVGSVVIWFALFSYMILLPIVIRRVFIFKKMHESTLPLITVLTAPGSLCLTGYINAIGDQPFYFILFLLILSQVIYFITLFMIARQVKLPFYPSYAAFTFPLVISATAINLVSQRNIIDFAWLSFLPIVELLIAVLVTSYVLVRYLIFLGKHLRG